MYSVEANKQNRYVCPCILYRKRPTMVDTLIDTGALYTCYSAEDVDETLTEQQFINAPYISLAG